MPGGVPDYADRLLARAGLEPAGNHPAEPVSSSIVEIRGVSEADPFEAEPLPALPQAAMGTPAEAPPAVEPRRTVLPPRGKAEAEPPPTLVTSRESLPGPQVDVRPAPSPERPHPVVQPPAQPAPSGEAVAPRPAIASAPLEGGQHPPAESARLSPLPARTLAEPVPAARPPVLQPPVATTPAAASTPAPRAPAPPPARAVPQPAPRPDAIASVPPAARLEIGRIEVEIVPGPPAPALPPARPAPPPRVAAGARGPARLVSRFGLGAF
jgi:hypothetical protein